MSRILLVLAVLATHHHHHRRPPAYRHDAVVADAAHYHLITYCVEGDVTACPKRVPPPWRPAGLGAPDRIERDDATGAAQSACCYAATWGKPPPEPRVEPPRHCDLPDCWEHDPR